MMKKSLLFTLLLATTPAIAGEAFVSKFTKSSNGTWCTSISNVGFYTTDITVKAFLADGTTYTGSSSYSGNPASFNTPFTLEPNETSLLCANKPSGSGSHGYAKITTAPTAQLPDGRFQSSVIASAYYVGFDGSIISISVNEGKPF